jgi:2-C-methyl-D-erythritol 4-phosphate cytidylyltransferase
MSPSSANDSPPDVGVLIPAGGRGERAGAGAPKQFRPIAGVPMLLRAIRPFAQHPRVRQIVVALPEEVAAHPPAWLADLRGERLTLVAGGATRSASVRAALGALDAGCRLVLVHDAARPFVSLDEIEGVIAAAAGGVGAVVAVPVADTLKQASDAGRVMRTVPRDDLWRALTPQGFPRTVFEEAYRAAGAAAAATDDAGLVEALGRPVVLVPGRVTNFKVTTADDFVVAEALARA